jgi:hypothetical protein
VLLSSVMFQISGYIYKCMCHSCVACFLICGIFLMCFNAFLFLFFYCVHCISFGPIFVPCFIYGLSTPNCFYYS